MTRELGGVRRLGASQRASKRLFRSLWVTYGRLHPYFKQSIVTRHIENLVLQSQYLQLISRFKLVYSNKPGLSTGGRCLCPMWNQRLTSLFTVVLCYFNPCYVMQFLCLCLWSAVYLSCQYFKTIHDLFSNPNQVVVLPKCKSHYVTSI